MTKRLLLIIFIFLTVKLQAQTSVTFSIQAHADDWQLFMSSKIVADLTAGAKVVFITLTAGDASAGAVAYGPSNVPFYLSRENGSVYSSKYLADIVLGGTPQGTPVATPVIINSHSITKYSYRGISNYFLRLPDGNGDGSGFSSTGSVSLQKLYCKFLNTCSGTVCNTGCTTTITSVDGATSFTSWTDLTTTLQQIFLAEKVTGKQAWIYGAHTLNGTNSTYNPGDHSDHRYSSLAAQQAATSLPWIGVAGFLDYASSPANGAVLNLTDHENAAALFGFTNWGLIEAGYATNFASSHLGWVPIDDFSVILAPLGNAPFAGLSGSNDNSVPAETNTTSMTTIPMIIAMTSPSSVNKDIVIRISPYETGVLSTDIFDMDGKKIFELKTTIENRNALYITLKQPVKTKGTYVIKNVLNDKYTESRKITVE
jgi:hypothetical protein